MSCTRLNSFNLLLLWSAGLLASSLCLAAPATSSVQNEITVKLFGQPCLLGGPVETASLKVIHSISPEQVFISEAPSSETVQRVLDKVKSANPIPAALDRYRDRLLRRLDAQLAFFKGLSAFKKDGKSGTFLSAVRASVPATRHKELETFSKKVEANRKIDGDATVLLLDQFNDFIEPDPEEEFHKAIQRMKVHYTCEFSDENDAEE